MTDESVQNYGPPHLFVIVSGELTMVFVGSPKQLGFIPWLPTYPARGGYGPGATPVIGAPLGG